MPGLIFVIDHEGSTTTDAVLEMLEPIAYDRGFVVMLATEAGEDAKAWMEASVGVLHIHAEVRDRGGERDKWERVITEGDGKRSRRTRHKRGKRGLWDEAKRVAQSVDRSGALFEIDGKRSPDETEEAFEAWLGSVSRRPFV